MTAPNRYLDEGDTRLDISKPTREDPTLVVCPACASKAFVLPLFEEETTVKAVCPSCGFSKTTPGTSLRFNWHADNPTDGYFGLTLWLTTRCAGHSLWAFNNRHLDLLEAYVSAQLRERGRDQTGWRNASVASRLPRWITSASNREEVRGAIRALRKKA